MTPAKVTLERVALLAALADGIIPPDDRDGGASSVHAGSRLAERIRSGVNSSLYLHGIETAESVAQQKFQRSVAKLSAEQLHQLLEIIREQMPAFFKQLRMDVSALYLSDPDVWQRIGFPGPSTASGGYPDFDQPQTEKMIQLKEPPL